MKETICIGSFVILLLRSRSLLTSKRYLNRFSFLSSLIRSSNVSPPTVEAVLYCFNVGMASTDFTVHEATMMQAAASATPKLSKVDDGCRGGLVALLLLFILAFEPPKFREFILLLNS